MELYEDFLKQGSEEFRRNSDRKHREECDYGLQLNDATSSVTHALKSSSPCKERSRKDKREFRRHEHSRSHRRTETELERRHSKY